MFSLFIIWRKKAVVKVIPMISLLVSLPLQLIESESLLVKFTT